MTAGRFDSMQTMTGRDALKALMQERYDGVLLDLGLPAGSGWQLLPVIRDLQPQARVVIVTGN